MAPGPHPRRDLSLMPRGRPRGMAAGASVPSQKSVGIRPALQSRLAALLIAQIFPIFSLFAPCHPGASPSSVLNGFLTRDTSTGCWFQAAGCWWLVAGWRDSSCVVSGRPRSRVRHGERSIFLRAQLDPIARRLVEIRDAIVGEILRPFVARAMELPHVLDALHTMQRRERVGRATLRGAVVDDGHARR